MLKAIGLFFIIILGISLLPIKLFFHFYREPNLILIEANICVWFIPIRIKLVNPMTGLFWIFSRNRPWKKKPPEDLRAANLPWARFFARLWRMHKISRGVYLGTFRFIKKIAKPVKVKKLHMYTEIGLEDAAETAIAVGVVWGLLGNIYSQMAKLFDMGSAQNELAVIPNFKRTNLVVVDYSCIFELRMGHIIIVIYQLLKYIRQIWNLLRGVST